MAEEKKVVTRTPQEAYNYTMAKIYDLEAKVKALEEKVEALESRSTSGSEGLRG